MRSHFNSYGKDYIPPSNVVPSTLHENILNSPKFSILKKTQNTIRKVKLSKINLFQV